MTNEVSLARPNEAQRLAPALHLRHQAKRFIVVPWACRFEKVLMLDDVSLACPIQAQRLVPALHLRHQAKGFPRRFLGMPREEGFNDG
jgi:hypothetical protein